MDFVRYQHVERLGTPNPEVDGLLNGKVYVFPKIDGSNHCVYFDKELDRVAYASRNQLLSEGYDSTGFWHFAEAHPKLAKFVESNVDYRIYGEYLTPHTLRNYEDNAWNRFYVFDVWDDGEGRWLYLEEIERFFDEMEDEDVKLIPVIEVLENPTLEDLMEVMDKDKFLLQEGTKGEGIVVKNYGYRNPYGRQTWGKIVRENFKSKSKGQAEELPEEKAVRESITQEFVSKEFYKFTADRGVTWNDKLIPDFLRYIWKEWWTDYSFEALSDLKTIDMKEVRKACSKSVMGKLRRVDTGKKDRDMGWEKDAQTGAGETP